MQCTGTCSVQVHAVYRYIQCTGTCSVQLCAVCRCMQCTHYIDVKDVVRPLLASSSRMFDVLVVGPTEGNPGDLDTSLYQERSQLEVEGVHRALTIDNLDGIPGLVPPRVRDANPLEVGNLEPNSKYLIFTRTEYFMDVSGREHYCGYVQ